MTRPDPDAQRLHWVEENAGISNDHDEETEEDTTTPLRDTLDWHER